MNWFWDKAPGEPHIVRFQNGQFGIRRRSGKGYQFLDARNEGDDFWVTYPPSVATLCAGTREEIDARLARYPSAPIIKQPKPGEDLGEPV